MKNVKNSADFKRIYRMALVGILSAVAFVLMLLEFPLTILAPDFYKLDFSELPVIIGAFALGPIEGVVIEFLKILLHLLVKGTTTKFIGELANFVVGISYVLPAALFYYFKKTKKVATVGLITSTLTAIAFGAFANAFILLPWYAKHQLGGSMDYLIDAGHKVNPLITDLKSFILLAVVPFNLLKYTIVTIITLLVYKRISIVLKNPMERV